MSFFKEIRYLFEWLEDHALSSGAFSLWVVLMVFNSWCALLTTSGEWLWRVEFVIGNKRITDVMHCSERQMMRYRQELEDKGRIIYQKGNAKGAGIYTMVPLRPNVKPCEIKHVLSQKATMVYDYAGNPESFLLEPEKDSGKSCPQA
ncbi:hypothetical protein [Eubacterium maltosivorans]|uniref:Uncharacterized protein n=1 Tax=Eubacterium maltosivorans TaxID=2041044 RepID=A0A4P9C5G0_EUBML|nr:hypothetical protein [Eubacterium maltosivorans]QCT70583.1 hypothetical protein CPZ25_004340 [Eubacterium maltosivorans]